jgi:hypothetical protein
MYQPTEFVEQNENDDMEEPNIEKLYVQTIHGTIIVNQYAYIPFEPSVEHYLIAIGDYENSYCTKCGIFGTKFPQMCISTSFDLSKHINRYMWPNMLFLVHPRCKKHRFQWKYVVARCMRKNNMFNDLMSTIGSYIMPAETFFDWFSPDQPTYSKPMCSVPECQIKTSCLNPLVVDEHCGIEELISTNFQILPLGII